jgi:hypothetical protein
MHVAMPLLSKPPIDFSQACLQPALVLYTIRLDTPNRPHMLGAVYWSFFAFLILSNHTHPLQSQPIDSKVGIGLD